MAKKTALGLLLPVERGWNGYFNQGFDARTQVKSNIVSLILTKKGERIMQPDFGCNIHNVIFGQITDELIATARAAIEDAIRDWMPFVIIKSLEIASNATEKDRNEVYVTLTYSIRNNTTITDTVSLVLVE